VPTSTGDHNRLLIPKSRWIELPRTYLTHDIAFNKQTTTRTRLLKTMDSIRSKPLSVAPAPQRAQNQQEHISRMPPELLVRIFKFDLGAQNSPRKLRSEARLLRIISLSSVCSRWRTAALETSSFWTCIPLHFNNNLVAACVARAGDMPLEVVGVDRNIGLVSGEPWPAACIGSVQQYAGRLNQPFHVYESSR
ncbi:unnamed protein product, partial [Rhizoctonia solani]